MLLNSSSPSNSSLGYLVYHCSDSSVNLLIRTFFSTTRAVLFLPLSILVLCLGYQRWRQQRSFAKMSHSDIFTYHMVAVELIGISGRFCYLCGSYANLRELVIVGFLASSATFCGQVFFHLLTCVERYLAVVHPVTFLGLRNARGVRIRNISIGCVWLICIGWIGVLVLHFPSFPIFPFMGVVGFSLVVVSFCSLSVLCVLLRPGPGEVGRDKEKPKLKVFFTITAIMGTLCLGFAGVLVLPLLSSSECLAVASVDCLNLPSSLVLPLLYLHRAGKLSCRCYNK